MGLSIGPDDFDSLALGDTPLEALMLGDVELWSAGGGGDVALVPMSWSGGSVPMTDRLATYEVVNYTVVGSGAADLSATMEAGGFGGQGTSSSRDMHLFVNGVEVGYQRFSFSGTTTHRHTFRQILLQEGDVLTYGLRNLSLSTSWALRSWSLNLVPLTPTSTSLTVDPVEVVQGDTVTVTATVSPLELTGSVTFTGGGNTSTVDVVNGVATSTLTLMWGGDVTARFTPSDASYGASIDTKSVDVELPVLALTGTTGTDSMNQFRNALTALGLNYTTIEKVPFELDVSQATSLRSLFYQCGKLKEVPPMDTSNVTNMYQMFRECSSLTSVPEMDTSNVTDMAHMFRQCSSLTFVPDLVTHNVTAATFMFYQDTLLTDGNVRLIGKYPSVTRSSMIAGSGLTREPWYDVNGNPI